MAGYRSCGVWIGHRPGFVWCLPASMRMRYGLRRCRVPCAGGRPCCALIFFGMRSRCLENRCPRCRMPYCAAIGKRCFPWSSRVMRVVCRGGSGNSAAASHRPQTHGSRFGSHARLRGEAQKRQSPVHIPRRALRRACAAGPGMHRAFGAGARGGSVCGRCAARRR